MPAGNRSEIGVRAPDTYPQNLPKKISKETFKI